MSAQDTVSLPSSVRAVTVSRSATVRYRMIDADRMTGMTSSSATHAGPAKHQGQQAEREEADGEMRHWRDPDDDRGGGGGAHTAIFPSGI